MEFITFGGMRITLKSWIALAIIPQLLAVQWLAGHTGFVETYYSEGLYPYLSTAMRHILGWMPISIGDLCYTFLIFVGLRYIILKRHYILAFPLRFIRDMAMVFSIVYFSFYLLWGLNYFREPLKQRLALEESNDYGELVAFTESLIRKTNASHEALSQNTKAAIHIPYSQEEMFSKTLAGYQHLAQSHPFLTYAPPSIKNSMYSNILTYMGYAGYLNPFTGEAQTNAKLPNFRFPVVAGHEIGHQLGYSAENETNFIGYLVTINNPDPYFQYAGYAYALGYCLNDIRRGDEETFKVLMAKLHEGVKNNFKEMNAFWKEYENPMEPLFKMMFNNFLKVNRQSKGILSYNAMVAF